VWDVTRDFRWYASTDPSTMTILLWTKGNKHADRFKKVSLEALNKTHFNSSHPVKILFHGFSDKASTRWTRAVSNAYMRSGDYNVFSVDWESLAQSPWYTTAAKNAVFPAHLATDLIALLTSQEVGVAWKDIHLIGASLGAHAAAVAGYLTEGKCGRLTGLDPSGPLHHSVHPWLRVDPTDAQYVEVIHSAGKWVGDEDVSGHADFFPNLGRAPQPGCAGRESLDLTCSHFVSWHMFAKSIDAGLDGDDRFLSLRCRSEKDFTSGKCCERALEKDQLEAGDLSLVGEFVDIAKASGLYYLWTDGKEAKPLEEALGCPLLLEEEKL